MAYKLESFGAVLLPEFNTRYALDTVPAKNTIVRTVAGGYDSRGSEQADMDLPLAIRYKGVIVEDTLADWRTAVDALRAVSRKRALLRRRAWDDDEEQFCHARFMSAQVERGYQDSRLYETTLQFLQLTPWVGHDYTVWELDAGYFLDAGLYLDEEGLIYTLDSSPYTATITNGGNRSTNNIRLTLTAGSVAITEVTFTCGDAEFTFGGTIAIGDDLVIDTGAQSVLNDGTAAFADFELTSNHTIEDWLVFAPGDNDLVITLTGGSTDSELVVEFQDGWE